MNANTPRLGRPKDESKRAAIFTAAQKLFLKRGLQGTSVDTIAADAGVSKLTVYSHFADKDTLFKAVITDKCEQLSPPESFLGLAELGPQEALIQIAESFVRLMSNADVLAMHRVVIGEAANNPRIAQLFYEAGPERFMAAFIALLHRFNESGELRTPDAPIACDQFFHMLKGDYHERLLLNLKPKPTPEETRAYARECVGVFLRAYGAKGERGRGKGRG